MQSLITAFLSLILAFFITTTQAQHHRETKISMLLQPTEQNMKQDQFKSVLPPIMVEGNKNLFRNFALGWETGFAYYQRNDLTGDGRPDKKIILQLSIKGIIQLEPIKDLSIFGGPAFGYFYTISEEPNVGSVNAQSYHPFLFAGVDFMFSDRFGIFGEAGYMRVNPQKSKSYFKLGVILTP